MKPKNKRKIKPRNPIARALRKPEFRKRVKPSGKLYKRNRKEKP